MVLSSRKPALIFAGRIPAGLDRSLFRWLHLFWIFILSALGVIPMAGFIGEATEALAEHTGPKIGGLLNATLGNAAELIITLVAIRAGLLELVKASITGSILGNLLLVMGMAMVTGGRATACRNLTGSQSGNHAVLLTLAVLALAIPSLFSHSIGPDTSQEVEALSLGVSGVMIILYVFGILYSLPISGISHHLCRQKMKALQSEWSVRKAVIVLGTGHPGRGDPERAAGRGGRECGGKPGPFGIFPRDYPDPDRRECGRASGGRSGGHSQPDGTKRGDCHLFKPADCACLSRRCWFLSAC